MTGAPDGDSGGTLQEAGSGEPGAAATPAYAVGQQIAGRYEVLEILGRGASGRVYRVLDHTAHEEIAVKIIDDPQGGIDRLRREVRLARRITHPNVCRVFDIIDHRRGALLSMEYMGGGTLAARLGRRHSPEEARRIGQQILDGLEAAHRAGIVHRDLKPANVLLGEGGRVVVGDFGVARPLDQAIDTNLEHQPGTPAYMAPEQLLAESVDGRADLYAVGLILYELCVGHLPFVAPGETPTLAAALRRVERPIPPPEGAGTLAPAIERLLARDPARRPADCAAARALLEPVAPRKGVRPVTAALVAVGALGVIGGAIAVSRTIHLGGAADAVPRPPATRELSGGEQQIGESPVFLPDGHRLVAAINRSGRFQLWLIDSGTLASRQLTIDDTDKLAPHVAGGDLVFLRSTDALARYDLVRVPLAALDHELGVGDETVVRRGVAFGTLSSRGALLTTDATLGWDGPRTILVDGKSVVDVGADEIRWAWFSPDGAQIGYVRRPRGEDPRGDLWVVAASGGTPRRVAEGVAADAGFAWSPRGDALAFFRDADGGERSLVTVALPGGGERLVAGDLRGGTSPAYAPDGRLAWVIDAAERGLWLLEGSGPLRRITFGGHEEAFSPSWVPATGELAYQVHTDDGDEVRRVGGPGFSQVSARRAIGRPDSSVAVSSDGRFALYGRRRGDQSVLLLADLDHPDEAPRVVHSVPWPAFFVAPQFLAGGRLGFVVVAQGGGSPSIWDVPKDGGAPPRQLVADGGGGMQSADGKWMSIQDYVTFEPHTTGFEIVALDDAGLPVGARAAVPGPRPVSNVRFSPATGELLVIDAVELAAVDPATRARRHLADWPPGTREIDRCVAHPDGRIACALASGRASLIVEAARP